MGDLIKLEERFPDYRDTDIFYPNDAQVLPFHRLLTRRQNQFLERNNNPTKYHILRILQRAKNREKSYSEDHVRLKLREALGSKTYNSYVLQLPLVITALDGLGFIDYSQYPGTNGEKWTLPRLTLKQCFHLGTEKAKELSDKIEHYLNERDLG